MAELEQETPDSAWMVEALFDTCFAPGREALSSYRLRDGVDPVRALCLMWRDESGSVAGAIRAWPVKIGAHDALLIGPVAVHPIQQGTGLGSLLLREALARAETFGWKRAILVGDLAYYHRFGFEKIKRVEMPPPTNPERILGLALKSGAWDGVAGLVARAES